MELLTNIAIFIAGLGVLLKASDWFVDSAEEIGLSLGVSPFVIGITIVAFGTSLPELATSVAAVLSGNSEVVVGNVVGSNITNIALVLGLVAISVKQIDLTYNIWHIDMPYLWGSAFMLWFVLLDGRVSMPEIAILMAGIVIFLIYSFRGENEEETDVKRKPFSWKRAGIVLASGILIWLSADYTIYAISNLSVIAGVSPEIIALSAVAIGTSLPEIIVSIGAARKGKTAIAVGNVLGSNIFNTYMVIGIPAMLGELKIPASIMSFHLPLMIVMTILFGIMANNKRITQWEGAVLLLFYAVFLLEIFQSAGK